MSCDATLIDDRGHVEGDWNYTHNQQGPVPATSEHRDRRADEQLVFGPVRLDPVAPEPRLGSPLRTTLNLSVREQRFHAPFYGGSRSSRNANRSTHWRNGAVGLAHFLTIRPSRAHCTTVTAT